MSQSPPRCQHCQKDNTQWTDDGYYCLTCNTFHKYTPPGDGKAYWIFILGFIVLGCATAGTVNPGGVVVVLVAAAAFHLYAIYSKK